MCFCFLRDLVKYVFDLVRRAHFSLYGVRMRLLVHLHHRLEDGLQEIAPEVPVLFILAQTCNELDKQK